MRGITVALFLLVNLGTPLVAQEPSPRDLETRFGIAASYEVMPNVLMNPKFTDDDRICEMSFYRLPRTRGGGYSDPHIGELDVYMMAMWWASPGIRPTAFFSLEPQTIISGNGKTTVYDFAKTTMKASGLNDGSTPTFVSIQWKNRTCTDPAVKNTTRTRYPFQLLPGYKMTWANGFEGGAYGTIWKDGGPFIDYSFGGYPGVDVESISKGQELWREAQTSGNNKFVFVYTRSQELVVSMIYPALVNFRSKIPDQKGLAEVLLTILSTDFSRGYPIDADRLQPQPPPGH